MNRRLLAVKESARVRSTPDVNKSSETNIHILHFVFFSCHAIGLRMGGEEEEKGDAMRCDAREKSRSGTTELM